MEILLALVCFFLLVVVRNMGERGRSVVYDRERPKGDKPKVRLKPKSPDLSRLRNSDPEDT